MRVLDRMEDGTYFICDTLSCVECLRARRVLCVVVCRVSVCAVYLQLFARGGRGCPAPASRASGLGHVTARTGDRTVYAVRDATWVPPSVWCIKAERSTVSCGPGRLYSLLYSCTAEKGRGPPTVRPKLPIRESLGRTSNDTSNPISNTHHASHQAHWSRLNACASHCVRRSAD